MKSDYEAVEAIINQYGGNHDSVIAILQDVQAEYHYLPETALRLVAKHLELPLIQVYVGWDRMVRILVISLLME